jgi:putative endonuclease
MRNVRQALGKVGEELAARHLQQRGYVILQRNYRCPAGEMDIVAMQGARLAFVEVRTRRGISYGTPAESITARKQQRLIRVASTYLQEHRQSDADWGIDAVAIRFSAEGVLQNVEIIRNAVLGRG